MSRNIRIVSGLVLFSFVAVHLTNLALGVFSLKVSDELRPWLMAAFSNPVGGAVLLGSMVLHMVLGFQALYQRNTLRMTRYDAVQFVSAFLVPPLLIPHVWGLIAAGEMLGISPSYLDLFRHFWVAQPFDGLLQVLLVVIIWIHGCIGLFTWLKLKAWWSRYAPFAYPLAVAIPVLALLGFVAGGNHILGSINANAGATPTVLAETRADYPEPAVKQETPRPARVGPRSTVDPDSQEFKDTIAYIDKIERRMIIGYGVVLLLVLLARLVRVRSKGEFVEVRYASGYSLTREVGPTLLELANMHDIPHASLCRGRGRCGTCRVKIIDSDCAIAPPTKIEEATLARTGSSADTRLACQLVPGAGRITIKRLLPPNIQPGDLYQDEEKIADETESADLEEETQESPA